MLLFSSGINTLSNNMGLLSLADIWGSNHVSQSPSKLTQKIQEERLRRQVSKDDEIFHIHDMYNTFNGDKLGASIRIFLKVMRSESLHTFRRCSFQVK